MSLSGVSVIVTNAEKDSTEYKILTDGKDDSGFGRIARPGQGKLVEALARELARRGASSQQRSRKAESRTSGDYLYREQNGVPVQGKGRCFVVQGVVEKHMRARLVRAGTGPCQWRPRPIDWPVKRWQRLSRPCWVTLNS